MEMFAVNSSQLFDLVVDSGDSSDSSDSHDFKMTEEFLPPFGPSGGGDPQWLGQAGPGRGPSGVIPT